MFRVKDQMFRVKDQVATLETTSLFCAWRDNDTRNTRCTWLNRGLGTYYVSCLKPYSTIDRFVKYRSMKYCMFCGKKIKWGNE